MAYYFSCFFWSRALTISLLFDSAFCIDSMLPMNSSSWESLDSRSSRSRSSYSILGISPEYFFILSSNALYFSSYSFWVNLAFLPFVIISFSILVLRFFIVSFILTTLVRPSYLPMAPYDTFLLPWAIPVSSSVKY